MKRILEALNTPWGQRNQGESYYFPAKVLKEKEQHSGVSCFKRPIVSTGRFGLFRHLLKLGSLGALALGFSLMTADVNAEMMGQSGMGKQMDTSQTSTKSAEMMGGQHETGAGETGGGDVMGKSMGTEQMMGSGMGGMMGAQQSGGGMMSSGMSGMMGGGKMGGRQTGCSIMSGMMGGRQMSGGMMGGGMGQMMGSGMGGMMGGQQSGGGMMGSGMSGMMGGGRGMAAGMEMGRMMGFEVMGLNLMDTESLKGMASALQRGDLTGLKEELGLTSEQEDMLKSLTLAYKRDFIRKTAARNLAQLDLHELLDQKEVDLLKVQTKVAEIVAANGEIRFSGLEKMVKAKASLTDEQRAKLEKLTSPVCPGMAGSGMKSEQMGGMMGGQQTGGHMGGMMGSSMMGGEGTGEGMAGGMSMGTSAQAAAAQGFTKTKEAAGVTVSISYLNPSQEVAKGELAFRVSLETHSVDLDQYKLSQIAFLRDEQGKEYQAKGWVPQQGSGGHHVKGILTFSNMDATGREIVRPDIQSIEVVIKGLAGEKERSFKWNLS